MYVLPSRRSWLSHSRLGRLSSHPRASRYPSSKQRANSICSQPRYFPDPAISTSAEVGFSPFFCLSHSRDFRYGPHNSLDLTCAGVARAVKIEVAREDLREAITYQKSTTSRPVSPAPRTSIDQSPASRPKRRSAAVLARTTGVLSALRGGSALPASWNDPVTTSV